MKLLQEVKSEAQWFLRMLTDGQRSEAITRILAPDAPEVWKLFKYLVIGILSVVIFYAFLGIFRVAVIAGLGVNVADDRFLWNTLGIIFAFIPTNFFTYYTNRKWVFVAGRHGEKREFFLFTIAAMSGFVVGEIGVFYVIKYTAINDLVVPLIFIAMVTVFNYGFRKKIVFNE